VGAVAYRALQLALDMFEKRLAVYNALMEVVARVVTSGTSTYKELLDWAARAGERAPPVRRGRGGIPRGPPP